VKKPSHHVQFSENTQSGRASDPIVDSLEQRIRSGELADGKPLPPERELMSTYNASRTVIREVITTLTGRGLIENLPRYRPVVKKSGIDSFFNITHGVTEHFLQHPSGVKHLYESRIFIERQLVRDAATQARKPDIKALSKALQNNEASVQDADQFYVTDMAFHAELYKVSGNPIYPALCKAYQTWLAPNWDKMIRSPDRNYVNFRSHAAIFDAIVDRDPDLAEEALTTHLNAAWEYLRVVIDEDSTGSHRQATDSHPP